MLFNFHSLGIDNEATIPERIQPNVGTIRWFSGTEGRWRTRREKYLTWLPGIEKLRGCYWVCQS